MDEWRNNKEIGGRTLEMRREKSILEDGKFLMIGVESMNRNKDLEETGMWMLMKRKVEMWKEQKESRMEKGVMEWFK